MALQKTILTDSGLTVQDAYIRINAVSGDKELIDIYVNSYVSQHAFSGNKAYLQQQFFTFVPSVAVNAPNFIKQGYEYLKTLPEFADAIDA